MGTDSRQYKVDRSRRKDDSHRTRSNQYRENFTGHPAALADWNCKEKTLTWNAHTWRFLQEYREFRTKFDGRSGYIWGSPATVKLVVVVAKSYRPKQALVRF